MEKKRKGIVTILTLLTILTVGTTMLLPIEASAASRPAKVKSLKVASQSYNSLKVSWKKVKTAKGYQIYRATKKNGKYKKVKTIKKAKTVSWTNKKLTTGKRYYYKVRAIRGSRKGSFSAKRSGVPTLSKTSGVRASAASSSAIKVSWKKTSGASGYQLYRSTSRSGKYSRVKTTSASSYTNSGLSANKTYYYKVRSYRKSGGTKYSSFSGVVAARTKTAATAPAPGGSTPVRSDVYLSYGSMKLTLGQTFTSSLNAQINQQTGGSGAVSASVKRSVGGKDVYIYLYDTKDYSDFLMLYVCKGKVSGWATTADNMGTYKGTTLRSGSAASLYDSLSEIDTELYVSCAKYENVADTIIEVQSTDPFFKKGTLVLGGIQYLEGTVGYRTSIEQEERLAEHIINAVRATHELYPLNHNKQLYEYGTLPFAQTMAASDECTHLTENLTKGPLAGLTSTERGELIKTKTNKELKEVSENAAGDFRYAEVLICEWYQSSLHKAALLDTLELGNYHAVSEMAVAGADRGDGYVYWAYQAAGKKK